MNDFGSTTRDALLSKQPGQWQNERKPLSRSYSVFRHKVGERQKKKMRRRVFPAFCPSSLFFALVKRTKSCPHTHTHADSLERTRGRDSHAWISERKTTQRGHNTCSTSAFDRRGCGLVGFAEEWWREQSATSEIRLGKQCSSHYCQVAQATHKNTQFRLILILLKPISCKISK